ncbi:MAG TPA: STAS domain-containing protein [Symbiobacteriaceae bacterium]
MVIQALEFDEAAVLFLSGDLDDVRSARVREMVHALISQGRHAVVLDLSGVERVYVSGLAALLDMKRMAACTGGRLFCCGARPFIRELLRLTAREEDLHLMADLESALDAAASAL